jgi:hypothetical protein
MATNYIRKFEIGGLHVESSIDATNYIGDKNDVWTDDNDPTIWRIGDGVTPGGQLLISGLGSGITLSSLSVQQTAASGNGLLTYNSTNGVFTYTPPDLSSFSTFDGQYSSLTGAPTIPSDVSDLTDTTNLLVHFDGDYNSLTNTPTIPADVSDLTDTTNLLVHFDGDYNSLTNQPTIPADVSDLTDTTNLLTHYADADVDTHLNTSTAGANEVLSWDGADYAWVAQSGGSTFGIAGNTGTHTFDLATETLTFLGTTGQINIEVATNFLSLSLDDNIDSIVSIAFEGTTDDAYETKLQAVDPTADNVINLPNASGTVALTSDIPTNVVQSDISGITGADQVTNIVSLTQAEYDAITPNASTVYFIVG